MNNFSIRTNLNHMNAPKRKIQCLYLCCVSQLVKATDGSNEQYNNSYYQCNKTNKRISKHHCVNCVMYKPLDT